MSSYVYLRAEAELWSVGFYTPAGNWAAESDHDTSEKAAQRVHFLNGGTLDLEGRTRPDATTPRTPGPSPSYHLALKEHEGIEVEVIELPDHRPGAPGERPSGSGPALTMDEDMEAQQAADDSYGGPAGEPLDQDGEEAAALHTESDVAASLERVRAQQQAAEASHRCPDCGEPGERHGHQECSNPQDRVDHADNIDTGAE